MTSFRDIKRSFALEEHYTGGYCTALYGKLKDENNHILLTDDGLSAPTEDSKEIFVGVYLDSTPGDVTHSFEVKIHGRDFNYLYTLISAIYILWGN